MYQFILPFRTRGKLPLIQQPVRLCTFSFFLQYFLEFFFKKKSTFFYKIRIEHSNYLFKGDRFLK